MSIIACRKRVMITNTTHSVFLSFGGVALHDVTRLSVVVLTQIKTLLSLLAEQWMRGPYFPPEYPLPACLNVSMKQVGHYERENY